MLLRRGTWDLKYHSTNQVSVKTSHVTESEELSFCGAPWHKFPKPKQEKFCFRVIGTSSFLSLCNLVKFHARDHQVGRAMR